MWSVKGGGAHSSPMINPRIFTLLRRLKDAIRLGYSFGARNSKQWECTDIGIQRRVIQSLGLFLENLSGDEFKHPLIKDSLGDIVEALVWILHDKKSISAVSAKVALKFVSFAPNTVLKPYLVDLVRPLSWLVSLNEIEVVKTSAAALNLILLNLSVKSEEVVWVILEKTEIIPRVISNIRDFSRDGKPVDHILEMQSLLSTILWRWPSSRFPVWNDINLIKALKNFQMESDSSIKATVLKLYSAIALCRSGAKKLLEYGEAFLQMIVQCMDCSNSHPVRMEGFKLVRCLAAYSVSFLAQMNGDGCVEMMDLCCEPIVNAIICTMSECGLCTETRTNEQMSLLVEACRLALITRWAGEHHRFFWKHGIEKLLLDLLIKNCTKELHRSHLSLEEEINIAKKGLKANHFPALRLYIWNILGWLATRCEVDFYAKGSHSDLLITFACVAFLDTIAHWRQIVCNDKLDVSRRVSNLLAVTMMVCSPCNYIASKAISVLSEILRPKGDEYLKDFMQSLSSTSSFGSSEMSKIRIVITSIGLTCFLHLPEYRTYKGGTETLLAHLNWCLVNKYFAESLSFSPHLYDDFQERTCCWEFEEDWEGKDILLFSTLVGLAELISHLSPINNGDLYSKGSGDLASKLMKICIDSSSAGVRWYAAYILVYFGFYGFPSKLGNMIGRALNNEEFSDIKLILKDGMPQNVHGVILAVQSRSLLPLTFLDEKKSNAFSNGDDSCSTQVVQREVCISAHVDCEALMKLLEYVYFGFLKAGDDLVKKLRSLAKHCNVQPLLYMLRKKKPKWGTPFPCTNLTLALGQAGQEFSDLILEAEVTGPTGWTCNFCSLSVPHMHVHKVILWSSCDYLRALLESGMRESHSGVIKVPVSWEGIVKLVDWIYAEKLPNPLSGCKWDNMSVKEKVHELQSYMELYRLAEFWILQDVGDACFNVIVSSLYSSTDLSVEVIRIAADSSLWKVVEVAATILAPSYRQLYNNRQLDALDDDLVNMIRAASVQFTLSS